MYTKDIFRSFSLKLSNDATSAPRVLARIAVAEPRPTQQQGIKLPPRKLDKSDQQARE